MKLLPGEVWPVSKRNSQYFRSYLRKTTGGPFGPPPPAGRGLRPAGTPQTYWEPLRPTSNLSALLGPRSPTWIPQTYWEMLRSAGAPHASCAPGRPTMSRSDRQGPHTPTKGSQIDWQLLRPIGALHTNWGPAE